jgi:hypothetical protein
MEIMRSKDNLTTLCGLTGEETELDFSSHGLGAGDAVLITNDISDMGALSKMLFRGDAYYDAKQDKMVTPEPATLEVGMTEADFSNKNLGAGGAIIIGAWISYKDNGALTSLDVSVNKLARGAYKGSGCRHHNCRCPCDSTNYATDTTGMCGFIATNLFSDAVLLQVLLTLPMPSVTMGHCRRLPSAGTTNAVSLSPWRPS